MQLDAASLLSEAKTAPHVPPEKGAMKRMTKTEKPGSGTVHANSYGKLYVTHAKKGNARSYIQCKSGDKTQKGLWAEISAKQHPDHALIVEALRQKAVKLDLSRDEVIRLRDRMLARYC